jgi:hypothetical protein
MGWKNINFLQKGMQEWRCLFQGWINFRNSRIGIEKRSERRKDKEKMDEKAELTSVSEHFEIIFDAEFPSVVVFQG